jgi:hypothetical protein
MPRARYPSGDDDFTPVYVLANAGNVTARLSNIAPIFIFRTILLILEIYANLRKFYGITLKKAHINADGSEICSMQTTGHSFTHAIAVFLFNSRQIDASENDLHGNFTVYYLHYTIRRYIFAT